MAAGRRGNGEGSITKRANGTYQGRVRYIDPVTGLSKRVSVYGKSTREVRDKLKALRERLDDGAPAKDSKITAGVWMKRWRETSLQVSNRAETTKSLYSHMSARYLESGDFARVPLDRLKPTHIEALIVEKRREGYADSTLRSMYAVVRAALDGAVRDGLIAKNPAASVPRPRIDREEARVLTPEDVRRVLEGARTSRYYVAVLLLAQSGLRRGEAAGLKWSDVDLDKREIDIRHTLTRVNGKHVLSAPKTKRSRRRIPITDEMVRELRALRKRQLEERLKAGTAWCGHDEMVFTNHLGDFVSAQNLLPVVRAAAQNGGVADPESITPHTLRHSAATAWLEAGVHVRAVADLLGHSSVTTTLSTYAHVLPGSSRSAVEQLAEAQRGSKGVNEGRTETPGAIRSLS
ncbi:tyrosine-type recombinase/integrase [Tsukamurella tyrosinosolvens]|uniref:tyrosine-type recombinase/integrase n=1 Tax=Tsukamurella tyrosinosolvens TaxID=57704 RepID=UPI002DD42300|nr:site-specific integrase [Tsukamurella tyrosinosolvens]MEC4611810.1 site-specific integrase [Tsukamurella tyrosinosolvens]